MPKADLSQIDETNRTGYPEPYASDVARRRYRRVGAATGLTRLGMSHVVLEPGVWSSQRHWHEGIDEIVIVLDGEAVLIEDDGETLLRAGDLATFPKDVANGHHLVNRSDADAVFVAVGAGRNEGGSYPDIDLMFTADDRYVRKDGTPY